jgi:hypothetical protein
MNGSISGYVIDAITGEIVLPSELSLTQAGVVGISYTRTDERGRFVFNSLSPGRYSLGVHDGRYAPAYRKLTLEDGDSIDELKISLTPAAFIMGRIVDEEGQPPYRCQLTLIRAGSRGERSGYISDSGDHPVAEFGYFSSPPLHPGRYFLRFAGMLRKPSENVDSWGLQQRVFDFLYLDAQEVKESQPFDLEIGQTMTDVQVRIPHPVWCTVRGKLTGVLPDSLENLVVMFSRDYGTLDNFGGSGCKVNSDGTFENHAQQGHYKLFVWEMTPQEDGYTRMLKEFASVEVTVGPRNLEELEIRISQP